MLDSIVRVNEKYYRQTLLEECKQEIKETKMENLINYDLESTSADNETERDSGNVSDNETDNEPDNETNNESGNK